MNDLDMCQYSRESTCPNAVTLGSNVATIHEYVREMKDMLVAAQVESRSEIKDIHKRIDTLIYWVAGLSITNIITVAGFLTQYILTGK